MVEVPAEVSALTASLSDSARDINKNFYSYYNLGVVAALDGVRALPDTTGKYAAQVPLPSCRHLTLRKDSLHSSTPPYSMSSTHPSRLLLTPPLRLWRR